MSSLVVAVTMLVALGPGRAESTSFLMKGREGTGHAAVNSSSFQEDVEGAVGGLLGCGGHAGQEQLLAIERALLPIWRSLPKNGRGRVDKQMLRFLTHRYFTRRSSLMIRGFEPARPVASLGTDDILSQRVPGYLASVLESKHAEAHGFDLRDATEMVATIQQLIFDSESVLIEKVYAEQGRSLGLELSHAELQELLEAYMVHWMMAGDPESIPILLGNKTLLDELFPNWKEIKGFVDGQIRALRFKRERPGPGRAGRSPLASAFSFDEVHEVVGGVTESFASWWESDCDSMKTALMGMDAHHTGRVPLSKFHSVALGSDFRFGESAEYLRELGALDETSRWQGPQVIIPNYIQAASNCIVTQSHYLVCCANYCEGILGEIEVGVGAPVASPGELLALVGNMTEQVHIDDDASPLLAGALTQQLWQIAASHNGKVPIHGRLFAQWLHYAFPRECAFPHVTGKVAVTTPTEFGEKFVASDEEKLMHASTVNATEEPPAFVLAKDEAHWMSQWTSEEELLTDYAASLRAPWEGRHLAAAGLPACLVMALLSALRLNKREARTSMELPLNKAHFV